MQNQDLVGLNAKQDKEAFSIRGIIRRKQRVGSDPALFESCRSVSLPYCTERVSGASTGYLRSGRQINGALLRGVLVLEICRRLGTSTWIHRW